MLMVLMALVEAGRTGVHRATRWLWLLLSGGLFVAAPVSCGSDSGDGNGNDVTQDASDIQVLYGAPADVVKDLIPQDAYGVPMDFLDLQVLYGPPADVPSDVANDLIPQDAYGVPMDFGSDTDVPADTPQESVVTDVSEDGNQVVYGPPPDWSE